MAVKKKKKATKKTIRKKTYKKKKIVEKIEIQPSNTEQVNNFVKKNKIQLIIAAVVVIFFGYQFYKSDTFLNMFGLSHNDTVYDFFQASQKEQTYFLKNSCNDGKCLSSSHWYCGYNIDDNMSRSFWDWDSSYAWCLSREIKNAKSHKKLGDIVLNCGIANSYFDDFSYNPRLKNDTKEYNKRIRECSNKGL